MPTYLGLRYAVRIERLCRPPSGLAGEVGGFGLRTRDALLRPGRSTRIAAQFSQDAQSVDNRRCYCRLSRLAAWARSHRSRLPILLTSPRVWQAGSRCGEDTTSLNGRCLICVNFDHTRRPSASMSLGVSPRPIQTDGATAGAANRPRMRRSPPRPRNCDLPTTLTCAVILSGVSPVMDAPPRLQRGSQNHCPHCRRWPAVIAVHTEGTVYTIAMRYWECRGQRYYAGQIGTEARFPTRPALLPMS